MNYQEAFNQGHAGNAMPDDPNALSAWNAGARVREEDERVARANAAGAADLSVGMPQFEPAQATADAAALASPDVAFSAMRWALVLAAFVVFLPITLPASAATPFAAGMLVVLGGVHRPSLRRAVGAAFLGLLAYFAIAGALLSPRLTAVPIERISSAGSLLKVLAPHLGVVTLGQILAVAAYSFVAAGWLAGGVPKPTLVTRAFMAGAAGVLMFVACLLGLASALGL